VTISDRGAGLPAGAAARSTGGLANLRSRAHALGGRLDVDSGALGTTVHFTCALSAEEG
jgi:signal transduction histidine kinase